MSIGPGPVIHFVHEAEAALFAEPLFRLVPRVATEGCAKEPVV